jgi:squalene synthase HpnC
MKVETTFDTPAAEPAVRASNKASSGPQPAADWDSWLEPAQWDGSLPESPPSVEEARRCCESLARSHYENFHVATLLLPDRLREHFYPVYAYCRWADDLGDETGDPERSLWLLDRWEEELDACYRGEARHPVFVALRATIEQCRIPPEPFRDLIAAFRQDQVKTRYETFDEVLGYCRYSANPVGRLVLYVCGYRDPERQQLSDWTCTALQLANFWQDVARDYKIGRIYIPRDAMARHGYSENDLAAGRCDERFRNLLRELVERTGDLFERGLALTSLVDSRLALDIELFSRGGMEILRRIERQNYDVLTRRPSLDAGDKALLFASTLARHALRPFLGRLQRKDGRNG